MLGSGGVCPLEGLSVLENLWALKIHAPSILEDLDLRSLDIFSGESVVTSIQGIVEVMIGCLCVYVAVHWEISKKLQ